MEKWLEDLIRQLKREIPSNISDFPTVSLTLHGEFGKQAFDARLRIDPKEIVEKFAIPLALLEKGTHGVGSLLQASGLRVRANATVKGYSGTKYTVPFLATDTKRVIIADFLWTELWQSMGLPREVVNSKVFPLSLSEVFRYLDVMNGQKVPHLAFVSIPMNLEELGGVSFSDLVRLEFEGIDVGTKPRKGVRKAEYDPTRILKAYFIPDLRPTLRDMVYASTLSPRLPSDRRYLRGLADDIGLTGFMNPSMTDYGLVAASKGGNVEGRIQNMIRRGKLLGHPPTPDVLGVSITQAEKDPRALFEALHQAGMTREVRGHWTITSRGRRKFELEIVGRPKETAFEKILKIARIVPRWLRLLS